MPYERFQIILPPLQDFPGAIKLGLAQRRGAGQQPVGGAFGFERPGIRGLAKMHLRITMALTIMLALALGRMRAGQSEHLRSLLRPA